MDIEQKPLITDVPYGSYRSAEQAARNTRGTRVYATLSPIKRLSAVIACLAAIHLAPTLAAAQSGGALNGSFTTLGSGATVDLTAEGTADWAHWPGYDHKSSGGGKISNYAPASGSTSIANTSGCAVAMNWTDGAPTASSSSNSYGMLAYGDGGGFSFTVPADTTPRILKLYVAIVRAGGLLTAHLSDGSAVDFSSTALSNDSGASIGVYTVTYKAASAGQTLAVTWQIGDPASTPFAVLQAATLQEASGVPDAPTQLTATPGNAQVQLAWSVPAGATTCDVKRSDTTGGPYTVIASGVTGQSYTDTGLQSGHTYYYVVVGNNSSGSSGNSNEASATPVSAPAAPANLVATPGNAQATLSWSASTGATSYSVLRGSVSGGPYTQLTTSVSGTSYTDNGITNGVNYYYVVTATGAGGTSALSNEASALPTGPPIAPGTLAAVSLYEQISLTWSASPGATSYNLGRSTTPGGPYSPLVTSANTGYTDQSAAAGTTYYYVVSATNAYATSGNSNEVSAAALLRSPGVIGITVTPGNSQLGLHWPATNGAIGYNIKRSLSSEGTYTTIASGISSTSYTDSSLINGTNYFYVVSSVSNLGETFDSTEAVGTPRAATSAAVSSTAYGYNGDGLRAWKQNALGRTYYLYDGSLSVCELASNGNVTAVNTFIGSNVSSRRDGSVSTLYNFDPQGNPAERMDAQGSTVAEYMFDAYGLRVGTDNSADPYSGFGGEWGYNTDPDTGLELLTHRYYDPAIGSFLTRDPIGYNGGGNLYRYTINNPIIYSDPEGTDIKGNWNKFTNKAGKIWSETSGAVKRVYGMVGVGIAALNFLTPAINHIYDWQITGIRTECYQNLDKNRKWYDNGGSGKDGYEKESPFMGYLTFQEYEGAVVDKAHAKSLSAVETSAADAMSDYYNGVAGVK